MLRLKFTHMLVKGATGHNLVKFEHNDLLFQGISMSVYIIISRSELTATQNQLINHSLLLCMFHLRLTRETNFAEVCYDTYHTYQNWYILCGAWWFSMHIGAHGFTAWEWQGRGITNIV